LTQVCCDARHSRRSYGRCSIRKGEGVWEKSICETGLIPESCGFRDTDTPTFEGSPKRGWTSFPYPAKGATSGGRLSPTTVQGAIRGERSTLCGFKPSRDAVAKAGSASGGAWRALSGLRPTNRPSRRAACKRKVSRQHGSPVADHAGACWLAGSLSLWGSNFRAPPIALWTSPIHEAALSHSGALASEALSYGTHDQRVLVCPMQLLQPRRKIDVIPKPYSSVPIYIYKPDALLRLSTRGVVPCAHTHHITPHRNAAQE
jgi:hypothetical protein